MRAKHIVAAGTWLLLFGLQVHVPTAQEPTRIPAIGPEGLQRYRAAIAAVQNRELTRALRELDDVIAMHPDSARAHDARGVVLAMLKRQRESESAFQTEIRLDPGFAEAHFNFGKLLLESARPKEARDEFQRAVTLQSDHLPSIQLLLDSMLSTHDESAAAAMLQSLHQRKIEHPALFHLELASALSEHGERESAIQQYRMAFSDDPTPSEQREAELALSRLRAKP